MKIVNLRRESSLTAASGCFSVKLESRVRGRNRDEIRRDLVVGNAMSSDSAVSSSLSPWPNPPAAPWSIQEAEIRGGWHVWVFRVRIRVRFGAEFGDKLRLF
ncbi:hypothetical protein TIFTF001_040111 [Ficus carica]|uniref:Uncharacterized protein n=1 Tax=Ficus carica TaxID=3494 RepID=A0AA87YSD2_FICCA|nr:hypothetical protein TIFTF001_040111 [Ficus carica]